MLSNFAFLRTNSLKIDLRTREINAGFEIVGVGERPGTASRKK